MLLVTISALLVLTENTNGGYIYPRPTVAFKLPKIESHFQEVFKQKTILEYTPKERQENVVSYSVPLQNYDLHQHINNLPTKILHGSKVEDLTVPSLAAANLQNNFAINSLPQHNIPTISTTSLNLPVPENEKTNLLVNIPATIKHHSNLNLNAGQHIDIPELSSPSVQLQNNGGLIHNQVGENSNINGFINGQSIVTPEITKHIYFHVPPPEFEEPALQYFTPKKKIYKIIFIKVPSQARSDITQLQGKLYNQIAPSEEKTIIYVLSKKPTETQDVFLPKPEPSQHEVFFVKYNGNPEAAVNQISDGLEQPLDALSTPILQPGDIHDKR